MPLSPGARLGAFEIIGPLGVGGMGEVYRARDSRLHREVAIKILPDQFAADPERLARFEREARTISQLNHPNICALYDISHAPNPAAGTRDISNPQSQIPNPEMVQFLVLELVEGPTLADRIAQGPMPLDETVPVARQICDALEAAHDRGVVHRDLKPANIKLTPGGTVKVLDFGLAKAMEQGSGIGDQGPGIGGAMSQSPTLSSPAMTRMGVILGTAVYMSPEQAKGKPADKRSDVWAFGCVLYEMLTGKRAFDGEDLTDTIAAVVRGEPDWNALPAEIPPHIRTLVKGCLEKDRKARIADSAVARFVLDHGPTLAPAVSSSPAPVASRRPRWQRAVGLAVAAVVLVGVTAAVLMRWTTSRGVPAAGPLRLSTELGADASLTTGFGSSAVLSPDGTVLTFVANKSLGAIASLYVRRLDQLQASLLADTEGASSPFFSPDGRWIAFFSQGKLKKIQVTGGSAVTLCDAPAGRGGSWAEDGSIVFNPDSGGTVLHRVSSDGGKPEKLFELADNEVNQRWPQVLPGAKAVLFTSSQVAGNYENANIVVQMMPSGPRKTVVRGGYYGRYLRSGHLLYMNGGTVFAAPFDLDRLELSGSAVPAIEGTSASPNTGGAEFAVSDSGTVVYLTGEAVADKAPIKWLDGSGKATLLRSASADWSNPSFAPDGRRLAIDLQDGSQADVWTYDWARDTLSRLTFDKADDQRPVWTPDSRRIAFASRRGDGGVFNLYWQRSDGTGDVQRLTESKNAQFPTSWHPSGKFLAFFENVPGKAADLMILPLEGDEQTGWKPGKPQTFLSGPFAESSGMFSPDGRWLAYLSNESGRNDVYVRPFPGPGGKWQISTAPADDPTWSRTARELFFVSTSDLRLMTVPYRADGESFQAEKPVLWADTRIGARPRAPSRDLDLHPDGKRFAVSATEEQTTLKQDKVVLLFNFFDELRRIAPPKK